jgi:hypothetical protein
MTGRFPGSGVLMWCTARSRCLHQQRVIAAGRRLFVRSAELFQRQAGGFSPPGELPSKCR